MGKGWQETARLAAEQRSDRAVRRGGVSDRKEVARAERRGGVGWSGESEVAGRFGVRNFPSRVRAALWPGIAGKHLLHPARDTCLGSLPREARHEKKNLADAHIGTGVT